MEQPTPQVKILMSNEKTDLLGALARVKQELEGVTKKSDNPFFKSSYADLNEHLDTVNPILKDHGLLLLQPTVSVGTSNHVITTIFHIKTGQYISASLAIPKLADAQKVLAAVTYFRRGGLNSLLALKSVDDDGESAVGRGKFKKNKFKKFKKKSYDNTEY